MGWRYRILRWLTRALHRRFEQALADPAAAQRARLSEIIGRNADTAYGRAHGFGTIRDVDQYRARVPLVCWDDLEPWVQRIAGGEQGVLTVEPVKLFLRTSGSTGPAKLVPCTRALEQETGDARAWWVARMVEEDERCAIGKHLTIYSPEVEGTTPGGIPFGSNTGRIRNRQPRLVRLNDPVPEEVFGLAHAPTRYRLILRHMTAAAELGTFTAANPSTVLLLIRLLQEQAESLIDELERGTIEPLPELDEPLRLQLQERLRPAPRRAAELRAALDRDGCLRPEAAWPRLATVNTWRCGGAEFYEAELRRWLGGIPLRDPGFSASEGFVAIPFTHRQPGGVLNVPGHFFEFLPAGAPLGGQRAGTGEQPTLLAHELEPGMQVRHVLTTSGGLYRYDLEDVALVSGTYARTAVLQFLHRAGRVLSITGEKVTEAQVVSAARRAFEQQGVAAEDFMVGLQLDGQLPRYRMVLELASGRGCAGGAEREAAELEERLGEAVDRALGEANVEYLAKRDSLRLAQLQVVLAGRGAFYRLRQELVAGGAPDGQVKIPHLTQDAGRLQSLLEPPAVPG